MSVWVGRALRSAGALVAVAAVGAVVVGASRLAPPATPDVADHAVDVPAPAAVSVCAGPPIMPAEIGSGAFDPTPVDPVTGVAVVAVPSTGGALAGTVRVLDGSGSLEGLAPGDGVAGITQPAAPVVARATGGDEPARLAGTSATLVTAGDLRGLAAATCTAPTADAWLVGGSTTIGSTADLVLVNAGSTTAEVTVELWGPNGPVELPGAHQLVAPRAARTLSLGGQAPEQRSIAVHVSTTGGQVTAFVQDTAVRGYTAAGFELVVPGAAPATRQVIPGALLEASAGDSPDAPVLRLLAPGGADATAAVALLGPDGPVAMPDAAEVPLPAGVVTDVPLGGLPAGAYTVLVDAEAPVVAALGYSRTGLPGELDTSPRVERAWAAATAPGGGLVAPPPGTDVSLVVGAAPDGEATTATGTLTGTVRVLGPGGALIAEHRLSVDAASTGTWTLAQLSDRPADVTGIQLVPDEGPIGAAWALVAEVTQGDGVLASVLLPAPEPTGATQVVVREDPRLGLG